MTDTPARSKALYAIVDGRQVEVAPATEPLMTPAQLADALEADDARKLREWHTLQWSKFLKREKLPDAWRGQYDILHYELLLFGFKVIIAARSGRLATCRWRRWMRRGVDFKRLFEDEQLQKEKPIKVTPRLRALWRDDQRQALTWFRSLTPAQRQDLISFERHEEAERRAETRWIEQANRTYRIELERACGRC
jgi:hypothetical protein